MALRSEAASIIYCSPIPTPHSPIPASSSFLWAQQTRPQTLKPEAQGTREKSHLGSSSLLFVIPHVRPMMGCVIPVPLGLASEHCGHRAHGLCPGCWEAPSTEARLWAFRIESHLGSPLPLLRRSGWMGPRTMLSSMRRCRWWTPALSSGTWPSPRTTSSSTSCQKGR